MKIIDAHAHVVQYIAGFTSRGELRASGGGKAKYADGSEFQMIPPELGEIGVTPEKLIEVMDANGVERAVLLQGQFFGFQNEYTAEAVKKFPDRFIGAASYDPFCNKADEVKEHLFKELGFRAVKFEVSNGSGLMAYHRPIDLDGDIMNAEYKFAADNGLTFVIDIGRPNNCCWQIENLSSAVKKYPSLTFVICHLLAPQRGDNELLKQSLGKLCYPNVYFDLASLAANQRPEIYPYTTAVAHLRTAREVVGAEKLMFGTDMPSNLCRDSYAHLKDYIVDSGVFTQGELEQIFYDTALNVYFNNK
ncbi:MAG: amidohydrolase family protein [Candidatus Coproplasma sp.]